MKLAKSSSLSFLSDCAHHVHTKEGGEEPTQAPWIVGNSQLVLLFLFLSSLESHPPYFLPRERGILSLQSLA